MKVQLTCTHFALVRRDYLDPKVSVGDSVRCEVCNDHRTIVEAPSQGLALTVRVDRSERLSVTDAKGIDASLNRLHRARGGRV